MPQLCRFTSTTLSQLEPCVHKVIKDGLGFPEPTLLQQAINCVQEGGNTEEVKKRLSHSLEHRQASKLASRIIEAVDDFCIAHDLPTSSECKKNRKRSNVDQERSGNGDDDNDGPAAKMAKIKKEGAEGGDAEEEPAAPMSADDIRKMMQNTMAQIASRKRQLGAITGNVISAGAVEQGPVVGPQMPSVSGAVKSIPVAEAKVATIAELQAQIKSRMEKIGVKLPVATGPTPVILDDKGRTVDASGQEIQLTHHVPTLKANLRAKQSAELKEQQKPAPAAASEAKPDADSKFFDARVMGKAAVRQKRMAFTFNEPGKFEAEGNRLRMKAKLEQLQADISTIARKTGITSATQLAKLVPKDADKGRVPDVEWWDAHIMADNEYPAEEDAQVYLREGAVTQLIEHPIQMMPLEPRIPVHVPVFLTKKERKKLRRQNRREAWKEKQDKIRLGLLPPDEPKVKMSNLMRVLGNEAVLDPTKVEATVRDQMAKRLANHEKTNADRKLTPEQKKAKTLRKTSEDTTCGVKVAVYRIKSLSNQSKMFKVETNANQLHMTGSIVLYEDVNVVVVEGGPKQQKKYKQLMLQRVKWNDEVYKDKDGVEADNACVLVWEGETKERSFGEIFVKQCPTESFARDYFKKLSVEHYWDQAYSGAVLEATEDF